MSQTGPWSVKGIDQRARDAARQAAREEGVTLGAYVNRLILQEQQGQAFPDPIESFASAPLDRDTPMKREASTALDRLTRRIESIEARSTLAITGIDQSVLGLVARLENNEHSLHAHNAHVDNIVEDLRHTHAILTEKVADLEKDDAPQRNLEAMKALEHALGKLASHVYEENQLAQTEADAIKARMESGFSGAEERLDTMESKVQRTLEDAARRIERTINDAETARASADGDLIGRMKSLENGVAEKLALMETTDARLTAVEADVSGAIDSMGSTLLKVQERLNLAETTTDQALKSLETTFRNLDKRIDIVAEHANPQAAEALRRDFEEKFNGLADDLRAAIASTRADFANRIDQVAVQGDAESAARLEASISAINERLDTVELDSAASGMSAAREEIARLSDGLEARLDEMEARDASTAERVGAEMGRLADQLDNRVTEAENRNAAAIEQIGEQVSTVAQRIQTRQDEALKTFSEKLEQSRKQADARLSDAIGNVSDRLEQIQEQSTQTISPVQRAIASLARRIESIEDFAAPPFVERPEAPDATLSDAKTFKAPIIDTPELSETAEPESVPPAALEVANAEGEPTSFLEALPDFAAEAEAIVDIAPPPFDDIPSTAEVAETVSETELPKSGPEEVDTHDLPQSDLESWNFQPLSGKGFTDEGPGADADTLWDETANSAPENDVSAALPTDPLSDLVGWSEDDDEDGRSEARDSDVFDDIDALSEQDAWQGEQAADAFTPSDIEGPENYDVEPETADTVTATPVAEDGELATSSDPSETEPGIDTANPDTEEPDSTEDYIARARRAAQMAALDGAGGKSRKARPAKTGKPAQRSTSQLSKVAVSAVIGVSAVGSASYLYMNGQNGPDTVALAAPNFDTPLRTQTPQETATPSSEAALPQVQASLGSSEDGALAPLDATSPAADSPEPATPIINTLSRPRLPLPEGPIAANWTLQEAAEAGDRVAAFLAGEELLAEKDIAGGVKLITEAAIAGLPAAQYKLSELHNTGLGVPRDLAEARRWAERAARGGNVKAMHDLAVFMANAEGGPRSYTGAVEWFRKAAEFGLADSQYNLAILYDEGLGISPNVGEALFWLEVVARSGDPSAEQLVRELQARVSLDLAQRARSRANNWQPTPKPGPANGTFADTAWKRSPPGQVRDVQTALNALGYEAGIADDDFGEATAIAIAAFEADHRLPQTGRVSNLLVGELNRAVSALRQ